jgi:hypothetical protein
VVAQERERVAKFKALVASMRTQLKKLVDSIATQLKKLG